MIQTITEIREKKLKLDEIDAKINRMQCPVNLVKILEATDKSDLEEQYKLFINSLVVHDKNKYGKVSQVLEITDQQFTTSNGTFYLVIFYKSFDLRSGVDKTIFLDLQQQYATLMEEIEILKSVGETSRCDT